jgi:hypothetical protein
MAHVDLDHLPPLPADRTVGIGCIGAGFIMADCHLVAYRAAGLNPVAIAARRPDAAAEVAARHSISTPPSSGGRAWRPCVNWVAMPPTAGHRNRNPGGDPSQHPGCR